MATRADRITELVIKHLNSELDEGGHLELDAWMNESVLNKQAVEEFMSEEEFRKGLINLYSVKEKIWNRLDSQIPDAKITAQENKKTFFWRYAAAASIVLMVGASIYFLFFNKAHKEITQTQAERFKNDIPPGGNKAILTLGNGQQIILDSAHNGTVALQGNAKIIKTDSGKLAYDITDEKPTEVVYNVLTTPNAAQHQLRLPDGSDVWLNAASSIKYPTAFIGKDRTVEITGEVYFEVAKNAKMPFHVKANGADVQVLGTHFNVNAYADESEMKTTLLEGSIKFSKENNSSILKPGQQAQLNKDRKIKIIDDVDVEQAVAWKNGLFQFGKTDLTAIMRQVARWYDVQVVFENQKEQHFTGVVSRNVNISGVLKILESNGAKFEIDGKKIIVK